MDKKLPLQKLLDSRFIYLIGFILLLSSCTNNEKVYEFPMPNLMEIPVGFPDMPFPEDNEFAMARWELGKALFYDPIMSADSTKSCASCHRQNIGFSDRIPFSYGVNFRFGTRNSPTLTNVGYQPYYLREGGLNTLEKQVLVPIQEHNEFSSNILTIAEKLNNSTYYVNLSQEAYDRNPDSYVITRSIAVFERSLISGNSAFDAYFYHGQPTLSEDELKGMRLFFSEQLKCGTCHGGFNFTDYRFANNGLYEEYDDLGRMRLTNQEEDRAMFKTPTLRNIELTSPYMHDGSIKTLEEIVDHYSMGGFDHPNKSKEIQGFEISIEEKDQLIEFLKSLTDHNFIKNPIFTKE